MKTFILTGGIGSGKSTAGTILKELGAEVIDSDQLARNLIEPGTHGFKETLREFGPDILKSDGNIDRSKLAQIVFNNSDALLKLNRIIHPGVNKLIQERLRDYKNRGVKAVFVEMAILPQPPFIDNVEAFWVLKAPRDIVMERLKGRGVSEKDALSRMANQPPVEDHIKGKLIIISNTGDRLELKAKIQKLWEEI